MPFERRAVKDTLQRVAGKYAGKATFFRPADEGGPTGSCGPHETDDDMIVALNLHQYGNENKVSDWCFKKVLITHNDKSVTATITDACPGCQDKSLDLTPGVFNKLANPDEGVIDIHWCVIEEGQDTCTEGEDAQVSAPSKKGKKD
ncbi:hypothetical protein [Absidia glauca]|uniref:RlpA-like protein double-psi beta-barrel domain-containing protein n=1 Tax=Absidia glauca TaxID=4829 RepID=A0A168RPG8_ABSGL|nr:hypothetical protein [Absidia glauca]